jgi:hypothetical protein
MSIKFLVMARDTSDGLTRKGKIVKYLYVGEKNAEVHIIKDVTSVNR